MISDVEIYVNNHQICFEEKDINMYSKARDSLHTTLILSLQLYIFVVFFKTKIYIYQERTFFYISQKKTFLHDYIFPSFGNYGNLRKKVPSTFIYKPILMKIDMNANIVKTQILFYDV